MLSPGDPAALNAFPRALESRLGPLPAVPWTHSLGAHRLTQLQGFNFLLLPLYSDWPGAGTGEWAGLVLHQLEPGRCCVWPRHTGKSENRQQAWGRGQGKAGAHSR